MSKVAVAAIDEKVAIEDMPLETLRDYRLYNEAAAKYNLKNRKKGEVEGKYPMKQCPVELHPTQRIVFGRLDQPSNPLKCTVSDHRIHFNMMLYPGKTYDLPTCVVNHLSEKGNPIWKVKNLPDGSQDTFIDHKVPRFSLRTIYAE